MPLLYDIVCSLPMSAALAYAPYNLFTFPTHCLVQLGAAVERNLGRCLMEDNEVYNGTNAVLVVSLGMVKFMPSATGHTYVLELCVYTYNYAS